MLYSLMCRHSYQTWNDFAILMLDLQFGHQRETDGASCHGPQHKQRLLSSHFSRMEMVAHSFYGQYCSSGITGDCLTICMSRYQHLYYLVRLMTNMQTPMDSLVRYILQIIF
jgi:hypothetical protein